MQKLMKVSLHEIDVSGCSHDYGPDGTKEIAQALSNGKEWRSMQTFHPYVESGSEPNGLLQLAIAALRHKSMRVFRIRVKGQENVVQQAMRTTNLRGTNVSKLLLKTCCTSKSWVHRYDQNDLEETFSVKKEAVTHGRGRRQCFCSRRAPAINESTLG